MFQLLLEEKTGKPFATLMSELVLQPVGMKHSSFGLILADSLSANPANGYLTKGDMVDGGYHLSLNKQHIVSSYRSGNGI